MIMTIENKLNIGEMPEPCYLTEMSNTSLYSDGSSIKWIGMRAYGLDEQVKDFLWWRNFKMGDLDDETARYHTAAFVTRLYVEMEVEAAIGRAVDLHASNQSENCVAIANEPEVYGVYVQADKRQMFNFMTMMKGIKTKAQLRRKNPVEFDRIFQQAKKVLPYDRK